MATAGERLSFARGGGGRLRGDRDGDRRLRGVGHRHPHTLSVYHAGGFDRSGTVNIADFGTLRRHFGRTGVPDPAEGDANGDGRVDLADFGVLRRNFGKTR